MSDFYKSKGKPTTPHSSKPKVLEDDDEEVNEGPEAAAAASAKPAKADPLAPDAPLKEAPEPEPDPSQITDDPKGLTHEKIRQSIDASQANAKEQRLRHIARQFPDIKKFVNE